MDLKTAALNMHEEKKGKLEITSKVDVSTNDALSLAYSPGVAEPCRKIAEHPADVYKYTAKGNLVGVVTDGSAVLGLGNIGPEAALPVMEGKAILFKQFGGVDAFPICLDTQEPEKIIETVKLLAPSFGGINLEDITAPKCFEIEETLKSILDIPVFHDDQHGTAIVTTAALINSLKLVNKSVDQIKVVLNGPGAAGTAIIYMLLELGVKNIIACDRKGALVAGDINLAPYKQKLAEKTNPNKETGSVKEVIKEADVFIGVSVAGALTKEMVALMNPDPIAFCMANPDPEMMYETAKACGIKVMGTGRSDFPNQINNVLAFPGIFRGTFDAGAKKITEKMKIAAAYAIAELVQDDLAEDYIIPGPFDPRVAEYVAKKVAEVALTEKNKLH